MKSKIGRIITFFLIPYQNWVARGSTRARIMIHHGDKILLIKDWFGKQQWTVPGGGIKKNECKYCGAQREVKEEVGISAETKEFTLHATVDDVTDNNVPYKAAVFSLKVASDSFKISPKEILEAGWFSKNELPDNRNKLIDKILEIEADKDYAA